MSLECTPSQVLLVSSLCVGARVNRPALLIGLLCLCLVRWLGLGVFPCCLGGFKCVTWPSVGLFVSSSVVLCVFSLLFLCCFGLACFLLAASAPSSCPPPWLVPWGFLVQSVFCWFLPPGVGCILRRPVVMLGGVECCNVQFASALCGAQPSTLCCRCYSGAFLSFSSPVLCCLPWRLLPPQQASTSLFSSLFTLKVIMAHNSVFTW